LDATELCFTSASELGSRIYDRQLSPVEVVEAVLARIDALDSRLNAFCTPAAESARADAREAERRALAGELRGPLDGIPVSVKDNIATRGLRTTVGSRLLSDNVPTEDAPTVERLRAAGAVILGKTNTPEFAWRGSTDNRLFGPTRNPWDLGRTPGGSSGGAAAAVAAGLGPIALGTDGAGSIRIPASFCGLFGLKPSFGRVPFYPPTGASELIAHAGPISRTVRDGALLLDAIAGPDDRDQWSLPASGAGFADACDLAADRSAPLRGLEAAWSRDLGHIPVEAEFASICERAAQGFADLGCRVEAADPPIADPLPILRTLYAAAQIGNHATKTPQQLAEMDPDLVAFVEASRQLSAAEYFQAVLARQAMADGIRRHFERFDLLLTPSLSVPAFELGIVGPSEVAGRPIPHLGWTLCFPFNFNGYPAATVPCGVTARGLPVGLQIVGRRHDDVGVLRAAAAFEAAHPWADRRPNL
jgi:Asp-tRNA(Asn)/Glu-tRNA(Gln) amidotransferase A subunit family amidase